MRGKIVFTEEQIAFLVNKGVRALKPKDAISLRPDDAYDAFKELRWGWTGGKAFCPHCRHERVYELATRSKFKCSKCGKQFSAASGTPFHAQKCGHKTIVSALSFKIHEPSTIMTLAQRLEVNYRTAWRLNDILRLARGNIVPKTEEALWPYNAPHQGRDDGSQLINAVNAALPKRVPEQIRADVAQEIILGVLTGEISLDDIKKQAAVYLKKMWRDYDWDLRHFSFDQPMPGTEGRRWDEVLHYSEHGLVF